MTLAWLLVGIAWLAEVSAAEPVQPREGGRYYKILTFEIPQGVVLEAGALEMTARRQACGLDAPR